MTVSDTIEAYRKRRRQFLPLLLGMLILILLVVGVVLIARFLQGGGLKVLNTPTAPPTDTLVPTDTPTLTYTPTVTFTPTITLTPTPSTPYPYVVQEGDTLTSIATEHGLDNYLLILLLNPYNPTDQTGIDPNHPERIYPGLTILLPHPGMELPSPTPWPTDAPAGTRISYFVLPGDSLGAIAAKFNSKVDSIVNANKNLLTKGDKTVLQPGWILIVPVNLVTPIPTKTPTATFAP